jgi:AraC family transcriptional regulator, transcriptional activator FtrA
MNRVVVVAYDRAPTFELSIPSEVFGAPRVSRLYRVVTVAGEPWPLHTEHGWIVPARPGVHFRADDIVVVCGWRDPGETPPAPMIRLVQRAAASGAQVVSLCTGTFALAATGMLDGLRATTHWRYADMLARRYPRIDVDATALFTQTDRIYTSAGTVAGVDLCLHLIRQRHGAQVANDVARHLVVGAYRDGGQAQYIEALAPPDDDHADVISESLPLIIRRLGEPLTVAELAASAHLSTRQYTRRFHAATGATPYHWLLNQRINRARELLETTSVPVEHVATNCGFGSATVLRDHFRRIVGVTPTRYRTQFGTGLRRQAETVTTRLGEVNGGH